MNCPDCGSRLSTYALGELEALACERCEWTGIEADHRVEGDATESWDDALNRFYGRRVATTDTDDRESAAKASTASQTDDERTEHDDFQSVGTSDQIRSNGTKTGSSGPDDSAGRAPNDDTDS